MTMMYPADDLTIHEALSLISAGKWSEAVQKLTSVPKDSPHYPEARFYLAWARLKDGDVYRGWLTAWNLYMDMCEGRVSVPDEIIPVDIEEIFEDIKKGKTPQITKRAVTLLTFYEYRDVIPPAPYLKLRFEIIGESPDNYGVHLEIVELLNELYSLFKGALARGEIQPEPEVTEGMERIRRKLAESVVRLANLGFTDPYHAFNAGMAALSSNLPSEAVLVFERAVALFPLQEELHDCLRKAYKLSKKRKTLRPGRSRKRRVPM